MRNINEEHPLLHLPHMKNKPLDLHAKVTYFDYKKSGVVIDDADLEDEDSYEMHDDDELVPTLASVDYVLDSKPWFGNGVEAFNGKITKLPMMKDPYIDPDTEDLLLEAGNIDDYLYWTNPYPFPSYELRGANGSYDCTDVEAIKKSYNNCLANLVLKLFRMKTFKSASQKTLLAWESLFIKLRQQQLKVLAAKLKTAGLTVTIPESLLEDLRFDEEFDLLLEVEGPSNPGGEFMPKCGYFRIIFDDSGSRIEVYSKKDVEQLVDHIVNNAANAVVK